MSLSDSSKIRFKLTFLKDESHLTRKWKKLQEDDIHNIFTQSRAQVEQILSEFTKFKITSPEMTNPISLGSSLRMSKSNESTFL